MRTFVLTVGRVALLLLPGSVQGQPPEPATSVRALTDPQDDYPDISPDGRRIVFQSNRTGSWQLWLMNRDGTGLRRLTASGANDRTPVWSPDGTRILFSSDREREGAASTTRDIYVMRLGDADAGDRNAVRLTRSPGQDIHPRWAPGGQAILFNRLTGEGRDASAEIMILDADGWNLRRVPLPRGLNTYASLTPDGARLIHRGTTRETRDGRETENSDIVSSTPDGSDRRRLTDDPAFDGWPVISPDGRTIAFASRREGDRFHLYLMPVGGGAPRRITWGNYHYTQPAWSPDGRALAAYRWVQDQAGEIGHIVWIDLPPPPGGS